MSAVNSVYRVFRGNDSLILAPAPVGTTLSSSWQSVRRFFAQTCWRADSAVVPGVTVEQLLARTRERASDYFGTGLVGEGRVVSVRQRAYSYIYWIAFDGPTAPSRQLVLKVFAEAPAQFAAMRRAWPQFVGHPRFGIPRPLDVFAEGPTLVMEPVSGAPLDDRIPRIWWWGRQRRAAEADCRAAGQWLRFYQNSGPAMPSGPLDMRDKIAGLESSASALTSAGFDRELCERLRARALGLAERLEGRKLPVSRVHGEFTISNVLIDAPRVVALDFGAERTQAAVHDISSFLNSLLLIRLTRPAPWSAIQRLQTAFLDGYADDSPVDRLAAAFLQITGLTDVALELLTRRPWAWMRRWLEHFMASVLSGHRLAGAVAVLCSSSPI